MKLTPHIVNTFKTVQNISDIFLDSIVGDGETYGPTFEFTKPLLKYLKILVEEDYHLDQTLPDWVMEDWFNIVYGTYGSRGKERQFELAVNDLIKNDNHIPGEVDSTTMFNDGSQRQAKAAKEQFA